MNLFTKKPLDRLIAESEGIGEKGESLKRTLSATSLVALGIRTQTKNIRQRFGAKHAGKEKRACRTSITAIIKL